MMTVIGGTGTLLGPLVGATIWLWLRGVLQYIPDVGAAWKLILGVIFVTLVVIFRRGIYGEITYLLKQRAILDRIAAKNTKQAGNDGRSEGGTPLPSSGDVRSRIPEPAGVNPRTSDTVIGVTVGTAAGMPRPGGR